MSNETEPNNINSNGAASVEAHIGKPPFEEPSITKAILNFLFCKYGKSGDLELQNMFEASKLFLYCLNMWKFETPTMFAKRQLNNLVNSSSNNLEEKLNLNQFDKTSSSSSGNVHDEFNSSKQKLVSLYKLNYTRWMCYNYAPSFCTSLEKHETIMIFGLSFLKLVYSLVRQELHEKFLSEKEKIPIEKRLILWNHLPK